MNKKKKPNKKKNSRKGLGMGHMDWDCGCGPHLDKREKRAKTRDAQFRKALREDEDD